ncbi:MAG: helix-turn-helix domain-containing protein [Candidatus Woesearchaeota archaeon]
MDSQKILEGLFDKKMLTILKLFLKKKDQQFYLKEISKQTRVPLATTHRILNKLLESEIIEKTKIKHLKIYKLAENEKTKYLETVFEEKKTIIDEFLEYATKIDGIKTIMIYGREEKDKANLLIIGEGVDNSLIREIIIKIKEKYNFTLTHLVLTELQYEQMAAMNLYPGKKEIILEKTNF